MRLFCAICMLLFFVGAAQGQVPPLDSGVFNLTKLDMVAKKLSLKDTTKRAIQRVMQETQKALKVQRALRKKLRSDLRVETRKDLPDLKKVMALIEKGGQNDIKMRQMRFTSLIEARKMLTKEQRKALAELSKAHAVRVRSQRLKGSPKYNKFRMKGPLLPKLNKAPILKKTPATK